MLGRELVGGEESLPVPGRLGRGLRPLGEAPGEAVQGPLGVPLALGVPDLPQSPLGLDLHRGGEGVQDVRDLAHPVRCHLVGDASRAAAQDPSAPSPTASTGARPPAFAVPEQLGPGLLRLPVPVGDGDELLGAVGADPTMARKAMSLMRLRRLGLPTALGSRGRRPRPGPDLGGPRPP